MMVRARKRCLRDLQNYRRYSGSIYYDVVRIKGCNVTIKNCNLELKNIWKMYVDFGKISDMIHIVTF